MENKEKNSVSELMETTMTKIREMVDSNSVIGEPITTPDGVTLIPVSRVSLGFGSGGGDYGKPGQNNFGGGGGTGITVTPVAFLVVTADGETKLLNIGENSGYLSSAILGAVNGLDSALDKAPDILEKIKGLFGKKKKEEKAEAEVVITDIEENAEETAEETGGKTKA